MARSTTQGPVMKMFVKPGAVYLHREAVDFRKSINGLVLIVEQEMNLSPFSDSLFVFCNRARDKLKIVYWDQTGFCLWYKRLEQERFKWPTRYCDPVMPLGEKQFNWLLSGYDVMGHQALKFTTIA